MNLSYVIWDVSPEIFTIGSFAIRWYGILFALGLILAHAVLSKIYKIEGKLQKDVDQLSVYLIIAIVIGARLGHILFYEPQAYLKDPLEIFRVWNGGLASHGAVIGLAIAVYLFTRKKIDQSYVWVADRLAIVGALTGAFVRLGNLMNSEIVGKATTVPWAFIFTDVDQHPRHPSQLYEALAYFALFFLLLYLYNRKKQETPPGLLWGLFMVLFFTCRFLAEFVKENQENFEAKLPINMGQILSLPAILIGFYLLYWSYKKKNTIHQENKVVN